MNLRKYRERDFSYEKQRYLLRKLFNQNSYLHTDFPNFVSIIIPHLLTMIASVGLAFWHILRTMHHPDGSFTQLVNEVNYFPKHSIFPNRLPCLVKRGFTLTALL